MIGGKVAVEADGAIETELAELSSVPVVVIDHPAKLELPEAVIETQLTLPFPSSLALTTMDEQLISSTADKPVK